MEFVAAERGCRVVVAEIPFPIAGPEAVLEAVLARVTDRTRLAVIDHVTSQTALVFPIAELVRELEARGVDVLVDGAHAPGWSTSTSERSRPPTTRRTATSGSARRRAWASSGCAKTAAATSGPR